MHVEPKETTYTSKIQRCALLSPNYWLSPYSVTIGIRFDIIYFTEN